MLTGMLDAAKGCLKEELRMNTISHNLANCNVIGYKKDKISFQDLLKNILPKDMDKVSSISKETLMNIVTNMQQGDLNATGNTLDFAIEGDGFFKVQTPDGPAYTRKGNFVLDGQNNLTTQDGFLVLGLEGPVKVNEGDVVVDGSGRVMVDGAEVGRMNLVQFADPKKLVKTNMALFKNPDPDNNQEKPVDDTVRIKQGYVEFSNVDVIEETVEMIDCLRAYESYQKAMQTLDGIDNKVINDVAKLR
jgi:flagellar basal-body rod protein FlgG